MDLIHEICIRYVWKINIFCIRYIHIFLAQEVDLKTWAFHLIYFVLKIHLSNYFISVLRDLIVLYTWIVFHVPYFLSCVWAFKVVSNIFLLQLTQKLTNVFRCVCILLEVCIQGKVIKVRFPGKKVNAHVVC